MDSKYEQLTRLKSLLDDGVLTSDEFDVEKKKILDAPEETAVTAKPPKKPGFFSDEAIKQREEVFQRLPEQEQRVRRGAVIGGGIAIVFLMFIFIAIILFFAMLFGWEGVAAGFKNLLGMHN